MVTPAVLRLETEERVVLEAPRLNTPTEATVLVQDFPLKRHVLYQTRVLLSPAEGMLASTTIKVCHHRRVTFLPVTAPSCPGEGGPCGSTLYEVVKNLHGTGGTWGRMVTTGSLGMVTLRSLGTVTPGLWGQ